MAFGRECIYDGQIVVFHEQHGDDDQVCALYILQAFAQGLIAGPVFAGRMHSELKSGYFLGQ